MKSSRLPDVAGLPALLAVFLVLGCGTSSSTDTGLDLSKRVPVAGSVMLDGKPAKNAEILFEGPMLGSARTDGQGRFARVVAPEGGEGLIPGEYSIQLMGTELEKQRKFTVSSDGAKSLKIAVKRARRDEPGPAGPVPPGPGVPGLPR